MVMRNSHYGKMRSKPLGRNVNIRPTLRTFLILCEGERTEPNYFRGFRAKADVEVEGKGQTEHHCPSFGAKTDSQVKLGSETI